MLASNTILQGRYRIVRKLGQGGMGSVYEAFAIRLSSSVAIKESLTESDDLRHAFEREAQLLANLRHPSLTRVLDHFAEGSLQYLVMEYVPGSDLSVVLQEQAQHFSVPVVLQWADQLLQAVEYLHSHNPPVIHRDIKPANLKIGERGQIMLLDFGLAKGSAGQMNNATTSNQSVFGYSRNYASLEQIQGTRTDPRSDLYSLAATLYHLFTGQAPPDALARQVALLNDEPDSLIPANKINPNIPLPIASALSKAMALRPSERPHNAAEMRHSFADVNSPEARTQSNPESGYGGVQTFIDSPRPSRSRIEISSEPEKQLKEQSGKVQQSNPLEKTSDESVLRNAPGRFNAGLKSHNEETQTRNAAQRAVGRQHVQAQAPRNTRRNEIIAIALFALGLLFTLCLASYEGSDALRKAGGQTIASHNNFMGAIGANVAAALYQLFGLVAYLLPLILLAAAWRRFRTRRIYAPLSRIIGLSILVLACAALLSLSDMRPLFDGSFAPGGLVGTFLAGTLAGGLHPIGAGVLLCTLAVTGLLLAADFSFIHFYEKLTEIFTTRQATAQSSVAMNANAQASPDMTAAERVAEFMRGNPPGDEANNATESKEAAAIEAMVESAFVVHLESDEAKIEKEARQQWRTAATEKPRRAPIIAAPITDYMLPGTEFLNAPPPHNEQADEELRDLAVRVAEKCREFNVTGKIEYICPGPVFTTFEFKPDPGISLTRMQRMSDDIAFALQVESVIIKPTSGKNHISIIVPNPQRDTIHLREVIESRQFREWNSKLTVALGKTIDGLNYIADLARMPHLLIAGATGAGKSVGVNTLIVSILYKAQPDEVKFIMVDPKRLELGLYADIPHLATPIITDPKRASYALKWAVSEMERRYRELAKWGVRNIDGFNLEVMRRNLVKDYDDANEPHKSLPYLVIIIDEFADLMMTSGHEVEESITRLAQMGRAVGIHLVVATNRSSTDNITSTIKANFPARISFRLLSKAESQIILDANGAEQLLGRGDMLFLPPGTSRLVHVHGAYVDETEIGKIVEHVKAQGQPVYDESITQSEEEAAGADGVSGERDELYEEALKICIEMKRASTSVLQRRLRIGYGRAAAILDVMEREGLIGQADGARPHPILNRAYQVINDWEAQRQSEEI